MRKHVDRWLERLLVLLMGAMVLNVLWQVASRYLLNDPSAFTDELAGFLMIWVGLLGAAYATGKGLHLAIDLLHEYSSAGLQKRLDTVINLLITFFALSILVIGGTRLVYLTLLLEQSSANLEVPLGYVYLAVPVSGILMVYYSIHNIFLPNTSAHDRQ